jgi:hypothetical protein
MTQGNDHQSRRRWPLWFGFGAAVAAFLILVPVLAIQATDDSGGVPRPPVPRWRDLVPRTISHREAFAPLLGSY